jgi:hypothetical protein
MARIFEAMGWIVAGILLFAGYAIVVLFLAGLSVAMGGARKKPPTAWSALRMWLILLAAPLWGPVVWPINRLGYRVPVLGAPFPLGGRRRGAGAGRRTGSP